MDKHVERLLNRISLSLAFIASLSLLHLLSLSSPSLPPLQNRSTLTLNLSPFPTSSCETASRRTLPPENRFLKLRSTRAYRRRVRSFSSLFLAVRSLTLLSNASRVLCVSVGAGHAVAALQDSGVVDVTGVEIVDFPPLVKRADPHNLPFFDEVFDLGFSAGFAASLFPGRFVGEMERTVRRRGVTVLAVDGWEANAGIVGIEKLFRWSTLLEVRNFSLDGSPMTLIVMRKDNSSMKHH